MGPVHIPGSVILPLKISGALFHMHPAEYVVFSHYTVSERKKELCASKPTIATFGVAGCTARGHGSDLTEGFD